MEGVVNCCGATGRVVVDTSSPCYPRVIQLKGIAIPDHRAHPPRYRNQPISPDPFMDSVPLGEPLNQSLPIQQTLETNFQYSYFAHFFAHCFGLCTRNGTRSGCCRLLVRLSEHTRRFAPVTQEPVDS